MNFRDIPTRELYHGRRSAIRGERLDEGDCARSLRLRQGVLQVPDLVARQFAPVWVRQLTICDEHGHFAEDGLDANAAIRILVPAYRNPGSLPIGGYDLPM